MHMYIIHADSSNVVLVPVSGLYYLIFKNCLQIRIASLRKKGFWDTARFESFAFTIANTAMDELLHHCLRELSFDGDLGCDVTRLRDFIVGFYQQPHAPQVQNLDDRFCGFVWSLVIQQPTVRVGAMPVGITSKVWIAPQTSAKRKAKARGEVHVEIKPPELDSVPNAKCRALNELRAEYGDRLRIAIDPEAIYAAITGSHIRFPKLSPMVYSALQIITRGRDTGVTVVELGQQSHYDQKTCFYLVRQLTELDLVVKVRRGGVGTHFCIHKYFFERSPSWKAIRDEETQAEEGNNLEGELDRHEDVESQMEVPSLDFSPIDARHLSSLPLISARVIKLLKTSKNNMHASNNMLITLGFSNPTKTDRRFFQSRVREMIQRGLIEKVVVPSSRKKSPTASVKCFRLIQVDRIPSSEDDLVIPFQHDDGDEKYDDISGSHNAVRMNLTIHKQIVDLLDESNTTGMTLNALSASMCNFDKRTIELLLTRGNRYPLPSHLNDLGIAGLMETSGRERRHRYYTVAAHRMLVAKENLDYTVAGYDDVDFSHVGNFMDAQPASFYQSEAKLFHYQDSFKNSEKTRIGKPRKHPLKNPILPDGSVKLGRPKKNQASVVQDHDTVGPSKKRKREDCDHVEPAQLITHRIKKTKLVHGDAHTVLSNETDSLVAPLNAEINCFLPTAPEITTDAPSVPSMNSGKRSILGKRGRPPKKQISSSVDPQDTLAAGKQRGRQTKRSKVIDSDESHTATAAQGTQAAAIQSSDVAIATRMKSHTLTQPFSNHSVTARTATTRFVELNNAASLASSNDVDSDRNEPDPVTGFEGSDVVGTNTRSSKDIEELGSSPTPSSRIENRDPNPPESCANFTIQPTNPTAVTQGTSQSNFSKARVNVSHLRRENELYQVVKNFGGIINIQTKEFYEAHMLLLNQLTEAGEPTSAPVGTRTDKRTAVATFNTLERRGRVKQLKTSVLTHTGVSRPACIVYLPEICEPELTAFLLNLSRGLQPTPQSSTVVKIGERLEYGADQSLTSRGALPLQLLQMEKPGNDKERWSKNVARADQLFNYDDETIREVLLAERTTVGQLYGFIVGKIVRARELHLSTLTAFEAESSLLNIVSKSNRIVDISLFCHDLPLGLYCSLVSSLTHDNELTSLFATEEGRQTPVKNLPLNIHSLLQIGRSRARSRILDLLESLRALNLVTPLRPSDLAASWITCSPNGDHPTAFSIAGTDGWTISTPMIAPTYWHFNQTAPLHLWAVSEKQPPFWKEVPVSTHADGLEYWNLLKDACTNPHIMAAVQPTPEAPLEIPTANASAARSLRRSVSWNHDYILTWHQMQYLRQYVDLSTGDTPLQIQDDSSREIKMQRVSWITSAPQECIDRFFERTRDKILRDISRLHQGSQYQGSVKRKKRNDETKASLAIKAAEARTRREEEWAAMLVRLHPSPLAGPIAIRLGRLRKRFVNAGFTKDSQSWEIEITEAIREADIASKKGLKASSKHITGTKPNPTPLAPLTPNVTSEPSVQSLIENQGPSPVIQRSTAKRKCSVAGSDEEIGEHQKKIIRRHRFQWNRDYDELARDASVIIKSRCRTLPRLDWGAFEQVFPNVPRNTVRQRLAHLKEIPGNEAYLTRLEDAWHQLWLKHRGTTILPDDDLNSPSNFDLVKHAEFLRSRIDKNAIRVGFSQTREIAGLAIPASFEQLECEFDILETNNVPTWDFMWNATVEEGRERRLLHLPFTLGVDIISPSNETYTDAVSLGEATLKMAMGMPPERYDPEIASVMLRSANQQAVATATKNLVNRGVLSKSQRDPQKQKPGRQLKISENNQNAIGGNVARDIFQDAIALDENANSNTLWRGWPLTATEGDSAALVQFSSENKVEFRIDTSGPQAARPELDWNSKKADDDQIETCIHLHFTVHPLQLNNSQSPETHSSKMSTEVSRTEIYGHEQSIQGDKACCARLTDGVIDCASCLEEEWWSIKGPLTEQEKGIAEKILEVVRTCGDSGIAKLDLLSFLDVPRKIANRVVCRLTTAPIPLVFWAGYSSLVLVSSLFSNKWSIVISDNPLTRVYPRRWLDIVGIKVADYWDAALRAAMGVIIFRPGITQAELRWRLRSVYDRQEVNEILHHLYQEGFVQQRFPDNFSEEKENDGIFLPLDDAEEERVYLFSSPHRHWYQV